MGAFTPMEETSVSQQKALALIPKFVSALSFLASLYIVYDVVYMTLQNKKNKKGRTNNKGHQSANHKMYQGNKKVHLYHGILLGMSVSDCVSNIAWFFTTWPIPPNVLDVWGASGTQQTCTAQGFFIQTSVAAMMYSGFLAVYYFLVIQCGWTQRRLEASRVGVYMHAFAITFAVGTAIVSASLGLLNPSGSHCWIASVPLGCEESWKHDQKDDHDKMCERGDNASLFQWLFFFVPLWLTIFSVSAIMLSIIYKFWVQERHNEAWRKRWTTKNSLNETVTSTGRAGTANTNNSAGAQRVEDIVIQSLLYVGSFLVAWTFPTVLRISELAGDQVYFIWLLLTAIFMPTQGIWNLFVYLRPQYLQVRRQRQREKKKREAEEERRQKNMKQQQGENEKRPQPAVMSSLTVSTGVEKLPEDNEDHIQNIRSKPSPTHTASTVDDVFVVGVVENDDDDETAQPTPGDEEATNRDEPASAPPRPGLVPSSSSQGSRFSSWMYGTYRRIQNTMRDVTEVIRTGDAGMGTEGIPVGFHSWPRAVVPSLDVREEGGATSEPRGAPVSNVNPEATTTVPPPSLDAEQDPLGTQGDNEPS